MYLYKIIATYGPSRELDSRLFWNLDEAKERAKNWLRDEECDQVEIYLEQQCKEGYYRTTARVYKLKRED